MANRQEQTKQKQKDWQAHMDAWTQSGKTQAGYCREQGLNIKTFHYWRKRLKQKPETVKLVQVPTLPVTAAPIRLIVEDRFAIEVSDGFNPATLSRIVEVVRSL